jgi:hypothetical protein
MTAIAPTVAPVRCDRLTNCDNDDARRHDDCRAAAAARRIADNDATRNSKQQQRCGKNALHIASPLAFPARPTREQCRRGSTIHIRATSLHIVA